MNSENARQFHQDKLREFDLEQNSRPSDPEQIDALKPTIDEYNNKNQSFDNCEGREGVDDYDDDDKDDKKHHKYRNGQIHRTSFAEKYEFDAI